MLTTGEVAKLFHVSAQTVINWLDQGRLPYERIGKGPRRLTEASVLSYINEIGISTEALDGDIYESLLKKSSSVQVKKVDPIVVVDKEGAVSSWNEGASELFGYSLIEMMHQPIDKISTRVEGSGSGMEYMIRSPWQGSTLEFYARHELKGSKELRTRVVVSRYYVDVNLKGGYLLIFKSQDN